MKFEKAISIIIDTVLDTETGNKIPSYKALSEKYDCSRIVFQKAVSELEVTKIIKLEKSKAGNTLVDINYMKLLETYFSSIVVSCPRIILSNDHDELILNLLDTLSTYKTTPHFTFADSTTKRLSLLESNEVDMIIMTNTAFMMYKDAYKIFHKFLINKPIYIPIPNEQLTNQDEVALLNVGDKEINNYYLPTEYYLVCKQTIFNLFTNQ